MRQLSAVTVGRFSGPIVGRFLVDYGGRGLPSKVFQAPGLEATSMPWYNSLPASWAPGTKERSKHGFKVSLCDVRTVYKTASIIWRHNSNKAL